VSRYGNHCNNALDLRTIARLDELVRNCERKSAASRSPDSEDMGLIPADFVGILPSLGAFQSALSFVNY
jgi:hypothetical protein